MSAKKSDLKGDLYPTARLSHRTATHSNKLQHTATIYGDNNCIFDKYLTNAELSCSRVYMTYLVGVMWRIYLRLFIHVTHSYTTRCVTDKWAAPNTHAPTHIHTRTRFQRRALEPASIDILFKNTHTIQQYPYYPISMQCNTLPLFCSRVLSLPPHPSDELPNPSKELYSLSRRQTNCTLLYCTLKLYSLVLYSQIVISCIVLSCIVLSNCTLLYCTLKLYSLVLYSQIVLSCILSGKQIVLKLYSLSLLQHIPHTHTSLSTNFQAPLNTCTFNPVYNRSTSILLSFSLALSLFRSFSLSDPQAQVNACIINSVYTIVQRYNTHYTQI